MRQFSFLIPWLCAVAIGGCASEPRYFSPASGIEYDPATQAGDPPPAPPSVSILLPFELESADDAATRAMLAGTLGVEVPYVVVDDLFVSIEWSAKNLEDEAGQVRIMVNGANPFFQYVPNLLIVDPDEDPPPPPLLGNIPIDLPAGGVVSGVFREDQLREASIDLELITRGNLNPFAATLINHEDITTYQPMTPPDPDDPEAVPMPVGSPIPLEAFAQMVQYDVSVTSNRHVVVEYIVRIRDKRGVLHSDGLQAPAGELTTYEPAVYDPLGATP